MKLMPHKAHSPKTPVTKMRSWKLLALPLLALAACQPTQPSKTPLGALPEADFTYTIDSNDVYLTSQSTGDPFIFQWEIDGIGTFTGEETKVFISKAGTYEVKHFVFNQGGHDSAKAQIEILQDAALPCTGAMEFLTGCTSRSWTLAPIAGSLWVGPVDGSSTWWAIGATAATDRPCAYNDTWTFYEDGTMEYDTKGDIWAEGYMGAAADGCQPETFLQGAQAAWASGTHSFEVAPGAGVNGTDQLKLTGLGAFIGLPKATNGGEVTSPVANISYDILWMREDAGVRTMEIEVNWGGGLWRYTLQSN